MVYEFEGRTEKEAIDKAAEELGLQKDDFDVEILESQRSGLFKKGFVKIKVHTNKPVSNPMYANQRGNDQGSLSQMFDNKANKANEGRGTAVREHKAETSDGEPKKQSPQAVFGEPEPKTEFEKKLIDFTGGLIERMGYPGMVTVLFRENKKIGLKIESDHSSILIGKKGKNLDALQLLVGIYAGRQGKDDVRVILDTENYRIRREESLVRMAYNVADRVRETRNSILLEPMNPFDRRLIHTTLNDISDVETKSEGEGVYKQVRVYYRGIRQGL